MPKAHQLLAFVKGLLLWLIIFLYGILPISVVLLFREPEISGLVLSIPHGTALIRALPFVCLIVAWRYGMAGLMLWLAVLIGTFKHVADNRMLWKPPVELFQNAALHGKVAVVTGANAGIGLATSKMLSRMGAHVVLTCRSAAKCEPAIEAVSAAGKSSGGSASWTMFHLGQLESAKQVAQELTAKFQRIHYLFNNAGTTPGHELTAEGLEDGFGGMHLAHMALTLGLLPSLKAAGEADGVDARVIMTSSDIGVTSACGFFGNETFDESFMQGSGEGNLRGERLRGNGRTWDSLAAYGRAKLCNILFAFELNRKLKSQNIPVIAHAAHTGAVATGPARAGVSSILEKMPFPGVSYFVSNLWTPLLWRTPEEGARTLLFGALATEPASMLEGGQYTSALCRPYLEDVDGDDDERVPVKLWGNTTLYIHRTRRKALQSADKRWSERLWEVSLSLLANSPARGLVKEAP